MIQAAIRWLRNVPIHDALDRRNAPIMQLLLLIVGTTLPFNWVRHLTALNVPTEWIHVMVADMVVSTCALIGVVAIRRGHMQPAVRTFVIALLAGLLVGYSSLGFEKHMVDQTSQMLVLVVAGLVIGRRALWGVFGTLLLIFLVGFIVDALASARGGRTGALPFHFLPSVIFAYFVITLVLDRCITALRDSLSESERRRTQLELEIAEPERAQAQLVHSQKMELAGRMASGIAHDFSNILGVILGVAQERQGLDDEDAAVAGREEGHDPLRCVESAALRGLDLTRKLLHFSRNDPPSSASMDVRLAIETLRPLLRQLFPANIRTILHSATDPAWIRADLAQFELCMLSIASNARDAMPDGGTFEIRVSSTAEMVEIALKDTGSGMTPDVLRLAFEPFFSTKLPGQGTGLGLASVRSFVSSAGGTIHLESELGSGTTVRMLLPALPVGDAREAGDQLVIT